MMSPLHVAAVYFLPFTNRSECSAEVEAIVGNVLTKINPTVEWGAYLKVAPPAATDSTRCTWPDLIEFLGTEEVASHSNLSVRRSVSHVFWWPQVGTVGHLVIVRSGAKSIVG
jgi:hypothetical protein